MTSRRITRAAVLPAASPWGNMKGSALCWPTTRWICTPPGSRSGTPPGSWTRASERAMNRAWPRSSARKRSGGSWTAACRYWAGSGSRTTRSSRGCSARCVRSASMTDPRRCTAGRLHSVCCAPVAPRNDCGGGRPLYRDRVLGAAVDRRGARSLFDADRSWLVCLCRQYCRRCHRPDRSGAARQARLPQRSRFSARCGALSVELQHIKRLARAHEEAVALRAAKGEIGADLRKADAADQLALRREAQHAGIAQGCVRADPQIAEHIGAHAVRAAFDAVEHHVAEEALVRDF